MKYLLTQKLVILCFLFVPYFAISQNSGKYNKVRMAFYNLENYFDCFSDTLKNDRQFTPGGDYNWTYPKYSQKTKNMYKVIQNLKAWEGVTLIGLCEIENVNVIKHLLYATPLKNSDFQYIHYESEDQRGIDVALIYSEGFKLISSEPFKIYQLNKKVDTRNILYVSGTIESDTFHIFINHWTSRYRGVAESEPLRMLFSNLLKQKVDSLLWLNQNANIVILGDFNDEPGNQSIQNLMSNLPLHNLSENIKSHNIKGSVKYREDWFIFDQIMVSESLYLNHRGWKTTQMMIFDPEWILEKDEKYLGKKPFRTNIGFKYHGGYSDHLPVYIDMIHTK